MPLWTNQDTEIPDSEIARISMEKIPPLNGPLGFLDVKHADTGSILIVINFGGVSLTEFSVQQGTNDIGKFQDPTFLNAGRGKSQNSTVPLSNSYIVIDSPPSVSYKKNSGGVTAPYYVRNSTYFIVGVEPTVVNSVSGTYIRIISCSRLSASYENQYFLPITITKISGYVDSNSLNLIVLSGTSVIKVAMDPTNSIKLQVTTLFTLTTEVGNDVCALDNSEILLFNSTKNDFVVYNQKGSYLRDTKAAVEGASYIFRKEPTGCSAIYKSSGKEFLAMVYPSSNLNFTNPLFLSFDSPAIYTQRNMITYSSVDGQIFLADQGSKVSLVYFKQSVNNIPSVQNTTDLIFQAANYSMQLPGNFNKQQLFLFPNMSQSDRFYVLTRNTVALNIPTSFMRVYTKPLSINCKNPTFQDKQNSKEYYYKVGTFVNPDARREKQLMMIIRKDSLTISFDGAVKSPYTWVAAVLSAVAFGLSLFFMIKITLQLKKATAVDSSKYVRRADPASESLIVRNPNAPFSMASLTKA